MVVKDKEPGSSLDPSAEAGTKLTTKIGFDLTKPLTKTLPLVEKILIINHTWPKMILVGIKLIHMTNLRRL